MVTPQGDQEKQRAQARENTGRKGRGNEEKGRFQQKGSLRKNVWKKPRAKKMGEFK